MPYYRVDSDESEATAKNVAKHIEAYVKVMGTHPTAAICVMLACDTDKGWMMDFSSLDLFDDEVDLERWMGEMTRFCANEVTEDPATGFILWTTSRVATLEPNQIVSFPSGNDDVLAFVDAFKEFRYGLFSAGDVIDLSDHLVAQKDAVEKLPKRQQHEWLTTHGISERDAVSDSASDDDAPKQIVAKQRQQKAGAQVPMATEAAPDAPRKKVVKKSLKATGKAVPKKVVS